MKVSNGPNASSPSHRAESGRWAASLAHCRQARSGHSSAEEGGHHGFGGPGRGWREGLIVVGTVVSKDRIFTPPLRPWG